ncbi:MAG: hypothetical protein K2P17_06660 [Helicobacteraceae bacterium]|nr:hypothetical protein [Helicobacteraceae bacterium]
MGFELFGYKFFDLSSKVTYNDAFITIGVVCSISCVLFLLARHKAPK